MQNFILSDGDKTVFVKMLRRIAYFSGLEVINYCVMDNHFHLLIHVPKPVEIKEAMLIYRIKVLYGDDHAQLTKERWAAYRKGKFFKRLEEE